MFNLTKARRTRRRKKSFASCGQSVRKRGHFLWPWGVGCLWPLGFGWGGNHHFFSSNTNVTSSTVIQILKWWGQNIRQAFLDFCCFNFCNFLYIILPYFPPYLVLLSNLDLCNFPFPLFFMCLHINSANRGMQFVYGICMMLAATLWIINFCFNVTLDIWITKLFSNAVLLLDRIAVLSWISVNG